MARDSSIFKFRDRFSFIADYVPVFIFAGITLCFINVAYFNCKPFDDSIYVSLDWYLRTFFDYSFFVLIYLFFTSKTWRFISWSCYLCLWGFWLLNICYVILKFEADIYYMCFVLAIYAIFVIATVAKLTNRC